MLILHGLFGTGDNWLGIARKISKRFRVLLPDMPNHGLSPHSDSVDYIHQSEAIAAFLGTLGLTSVRVVGHSMGGKAAMALALRFPDLVSHLTVVDIAPKRYEPSHEQILDAMEATKEASPQGRGEADRVLKESGINEPMVRAFLLKSYSTSGEGGPGWLLNLPLIRRDYLDILDWPEFDHKGFGGAVAAIYGLESGYVEDKDHGVFDGMFPQVRFHPVEGAGHWLHAEQPDKVARLLIETCS